MNNIKMVMTGVLMTEHLYSSNLLNPSFIQLNKDTRKLIPERAYQLILEAKATAPQAMQISNNLGIFRLAIEPKFAKGRITKIKKIFTKDLDNLTRLKPYQQLSNIYTRKRLMAKQRRDKLALMKSQEVSLINEQKLITEKNSNNIALAKSKQKLPNLGFSSSGVPVRVLQRLLVANGYAMKVDGYFGVLTESAVKSFQEKQDLTADGIVGTETWYYLTMYGK